MEEDKKIYKYLEKMVERGASDLFITVGLPVKLRIVSKIVNLEEEPHNADDIAALVQEFLSEEQWMELSSTLELNIALNTHDDERFRVNIFYQQRNLGLVIRHIKSQIPTIEQLGMPEGYKDFIMSKRGLFLIVGATGSGKSTSLASLLEYRNQHGEGHILTVEDPIEFVFKHKNCIFTQREVNIDTYSYGIALKNALRQSPDVVFIGEIRDRETMESALMFSETGHLVVATVHANNTPQTFERVLSFYPEEMHHQVLISLSHNIVAICGQRLVSNKQGSLTLAYEIMKNEGLITDLIKDGEFNELREVMLKNISNGMMTFDEKLFELFRDKIIEKDIALKESDNPNNLRLKMSQYSDTNLSTSLQGVPQTSLDESQTSAHMLREQNSSTDNEF